ncbi:hypothetical protein KP1_3986 [Klebsiella pneumoniae subsp. pneumoniae NTUH-K2044]|nr:hypothetical protein KP1_3986 [Klebsiella pneumoniae subsp. pneumoniae NTUH-K2044]
MRLFRFMVPRLVFCRQVFYHVPFWPLTRRTHARNLYYDAGGL